MLSLIDAAPDSTGAQSLWQIHETVRGTLLGQGREVPEIRETGPSAADGLGGWATLAAQSHAIGATLVLVQHDAGGSVTVATKLIESERFVRPIGLVRDQQDWIGAAMSAHDSGGCSFWMARVQRDGTIREQGCHDMRNKVAGLALHGLFAAQGVVLASGNRDTAAAQHPVLVQLSHAGEPRQWLSPESARFKVLQAVTVAANGELWLGLTGERGESAMFCRAPTEIW